MEQFEKDQDNDVTFLRTYVIIFIELSNKCLNNVRKNDYILFH